MPRDAQSKEVEQTDGEADGYTGIKNRRSINHLIPSSRQVKEGRNAGDTGNSKDWEEGEDRNGAEKAFPTDCHERSNCVAFHDLLCIQREILNDFCQDRMMNNEPSVTNWVAVLVSKASQIE